MIKKYISLYYNTIRYLKPEQLYYRLKLYCKKNFYNFNSKKLSKIYQKKCTKELSGINSLVFYGDYSNDVLEKLIDIDIIKNKYNMINSKQFKFLNISHQFGKNINWDINKYSQLWKFNLHYFDYVRYLFLYSIINEQKEGKAVFNKLVLSWINNNDLRFCDAWHPYVISLRIVNWIKAGVIFNIYSEDSNDSSFSSEVEFKDDFLKSIFKQAYFLYDNIEYHLGGNHLIKNGKALVFAGILFSGKAGKKFLDKGFKILKEEIEEQILSDGGHYERSPMYHNAVLNDYLEIINILKKNNKDVPEEFMSKSNKMFDFMINICHPDKKIPLLNDSAFEVERSSQVLAGLGAVFFEREDLKRFAGKFNAYCYLLTGDYGLSKFINLDDKDKKTKLIEASNFPETGYFAIKNNLNYNYLLFDCGDIGPDYNPGHSHADTLSFELSLNKKRWFVDSGTYTYHGPERNYYRGTLAHNTVKIDGVDQSEVWSKFRVGKRAKIVEKKHGRQGNDLVFVKGKHNGYMRKGIKAEHSRYICYIVQTYWIVVDLILGSGNHLIESSLILHDKINLERLNESCFNTFADENNLQGRIDNLLVSRLKPFALNHNKTHMSEEFNIKKLTNRIYYSEEIDLPFVDGFLLYPYKNDIDSSKRPEVDVEINVNKKDQIYNILLKISRDHIKEEIKIDDQNIELHSY